MVDRRIFDSTRVQHMYDASLLAEHCSLCGIPATHKVIEVLTLPLQPMFSYLCCEHFSWVVGDCGSYPYDLPRQRLESKDP